MQKKNILNGQSRWFSVGLLFYLPLEKKIQKSKLLLTDVNAIVMFPCWECAQSL